ncbi:SEC-C metal-binding domain-containing protein [Anoxybacillus sp. ST4]|uniref:YecA family protein n=1 Tax=Anoxybacillus sp. ST4 TaxID=2864181 RepID=UPI001C63BB59|nr:SEC-C domain-containing protein [Anoxybacillus sp. ST4]
MSKVARNALCPCGSGKKYKHCCGNNVVSIHGLVDQDVVQHMHEFIHYAAFEHERFLQRAADARIHKEQTDEETLPVFRFFIGIWVMFFKRYENGMTIFDYYLRTVRKHTVRPTVYHIIQSWRQAFPTFVRIDELHDSHATVTDLLTGETKHMKLLDMSDGFELKEGQALAGIFVPHGQYVTSFATFFPLPRPLTEQLHAYIQDVWETCDKQYEQWIHMYPDTLQNVLHFSIFDFDAANLSSKQERVFTLFQENFPSQVPSVIDTARFIWVEYCQTCHPVIRKPEVYAAALHYIMADAILNENVSKTQLAAQYGISTSALSKRLDAFYDVFEDIAEKVNERLAELFDDWDDEFDDWDEDDWEDDIFEVCEDCDEDE